MADLSAINEITNKLENGVKDLFESDKYAAFLRTMSKFHSYSVRNTLLIHLQKPNATRVASYNGWIKKFNRQVKRGEKGIKILAPVTYKTTKEVEKLDPITQKPIIGEDGQPVREEIEIKTARFKTVNVFDISQTDGEPLPSLSEDITGSVERYELFIDALKAVSPLPIAFEDLPPDTDGYCIFGDKISIRNGMSELQTICAVIHEIAHAKLHDLDVITDIGEEPKDKRTKEIEAESVSFAVSDYFNLDTSANSFGYIAEWSKGRELKELNASLDTIRKCAAELIDGIDERYKALAQERGIDLSAVKTTTPDYDAVQSENRAVGANVLMPPVFIDGNYNRAGKKIRVTVEEPAGKYKLFSREEYDAKNLYFLTASGRIHRTSEYFNDKWNEETHKWEKYIPTEADFDAIIPQIAERFEQDMSNPNKFALYQHAAVLNRLEDCDVHNIPIRKQRDDEIKLRREETEKERKEAERQKELKYDARVDEIAEAIRSGKAISVKYNKDEFDGKNPVLGLFKLYGIDLPLRTQGWVNTGLAEFSGGSYSYYKSKFRGNSTTFFKYLDKLREAINQTPIEQMRRINQPDSVNAAENTPENELYEKQSEIPEKPYDLGYGSLGSGITVWNRAEEINGEYKTIAHISPEREVKIYDKDMPLDIQKHIKQIAQSLDTLAFGVKTLPDTPATETETEKSDKTEIYAEIPSDDNEVHTEIDTKIDITLPDPSQSIATMNEYGYTAPDMLPLSAEKALELFDAGSPIYLLYTDNTEELAIDREEIIIFGKDGLCGITKDDWETSPVYAAQIAIAENASARREAYLLYVDTNENKFGIYQIPSGEELRNIRFASLDELEKQGLSVDGANYEIVYAAPLNERIEFLSDRNTALNKIYEQFNADRPEDYTGRSVSVSDVIVLNYNGDFGAFYVDSVGFKEITGFLAEESRKEAGKREAEQTAPAFSQVGNRSENNERTIADFEADVNAGKAISITELSEAIRREQKTASKSKPSVIARLNEAKKAVEQQKQPETAAIKRERGVE